MTQSSKGFLYQRFSLIVMSLLVLLFLFLSIINYNKELGDAPGWTLYLLFAGIVLFLGIVISQIVPNTYHIEIINEKIKVSSRSKSQDILLTNIKSIDPSTSFLNSTLSTHEFYRIEFLEITNFGKAVYFKNNRHSIIDTEQTFNERLKVEWRRKTHANKT